MRRGGTRFVVLVVTLLAATCTIGGRTAHAAGQLPAKITGLTAYLGHNAVAELHWDQLTDAGSGEFFGFNVRSSLTSDEDLIGGRPTDTSAQECCGMLLEYGVHYDFQIAAVNEFGQGPWSDPAPTIAYPVVAIDPGPTVTEGDNGDTTATFDVRLDGSMSSAVPVTVDYTTTDASATVAGGDYAATSGTLTFPAGYNIHQTITVAVHGDTIDENDESFGIRLSSVTNGVFGHRTARATILDDDAPPLLFPYLQSGTEGNSGTRTIDVPISIVTSDYSALTTSGKTITAQWSTVGGTATPGVDYVAGSGTVTFRPGQSQAVARITIKGDTAVEGDEFVVLSFSNATNATVGGYLGLGIAIITDDD